MQTFEYTEKQLASAMRTHGFTAEDLDRKVELARAQAAAYVWGRQDAGESAKDTGYSIDFGNHWAEVTLAFYTGETGSKPSMELGYRAWRSANKAA